MYIFLSISGYLAHGKHSRICSPQIIVKRSLYISVKIRNMRPEAWGFYQVFIDLAVIIVMISAEFSVLHKYYYFTYSSCESYGGPFRLYHSVLILSQSGETWEWPAKMSYNPDIVSFTGYVENTSQAFHIIHAANQTVIPRLTRQLRDAERSAICSGAVVVVRKEEANIIQWTGMSPCPQPNRRITSLHRWPTLVATPNVRGIPRMRDCFLSVQILKPS